MIELIFARHGETLNNKEGILTSHLEIPLNDKGLKEAEELAKYLKEIEFDIIFSSNLKRAMQCSEKIIKFFPHLKIIEDSLLRERDFGKHQGEKLTDLGYPDTSYSTMVKHLYECNCPNGETNKQLLERINEFLKKCLDNHQNKKILVVTHGGIIMLALNYLFKEDIKFQNSHKHKNCYVSYLKIKNNFEIIDSLTNIHCSNLIRYLKKKN